LSKNALYLFKIIGICSKHKIDCSEWLNDGISLYSSGFYLTKSIKLSKSYAPPNAS